MSDCQSEILAQEYVDIPEWIPREIIWTNPNPPNVNKIRLFERILRTVVGTCWVLVILGCFGFGYGLIDELPRMLTSNFMLFFIVAIGAQTCYRSFFNAPTHIHIRPDGIKVALPFITEDCKWDEIHSVKWWTDGKLQIGATVRLSHDDQESRILLLGIIRALREKENPTVLTIPDDLLAVMEKNNQFHPQQTPCDARED